jgi:hypothetical protein
MLSLQNHSENFKQKVKIKNPQFELVEWLEW